MGPLGFGPLGLQASWASGPLGFDLQSANTLAYSQLVWKNAFWASGHFGPLGLWTPWLGFGTLGRWAPWASGPLGFGPIGLWAPWAWTPGPLCFGPIRLRTRWALDPLG